MTSTPRSIVVCVAGASGSIYATRLLELLADVQQGRIEGMDALPDLQVSWTASSNASVCWQGELGEPMPQTLHGFRRYDHKDFNAPFASGSNAPDAVIVAPCSMSTLARLAHGGGGDLLSRAGEVALKERKTLVLLARETPLSLVHLRNMVAVTEAGAVVMPAVPSFYAGVTSLEQAVDSVVLRALDHAGLRLP
jgi:4-hydroxy-3-polyprenylbenzoate decarboxylase